MDDADLGEPVPRTRATNAVTIAPTDTDTDTMIEYGENEEDEISPFNPQHYRFVKRTPLRPPTQRHDLYVTSSRHSAALVKRALSLLFEQPRCPFIEIHGLGLSIQLAIDLTLAITGKVELGHSSMRPVRHTVSDTDAVTVRYVPYSPDMFDVSVRTGTVTLIDDYVPLLPELQPLTMKRYNSAIHIRVSLSEMAQLAVTVADTESDAVAASSSSPQHHRQQQSPRGGRGGGSNRGGRGGGGAGRGRPSHTRDNSQPFKKQKR